MQIILLILKIGNSYKMKQIIFIPIIFFNLIFSNTNWTEYEEHLVSSTNLVLMFKESVSPRIGQDSPLTLSNFSDIENIVYQYGFAELEPVFKTFDNFNQKHYDFHQNFENRNLKS